MNSQGGFISPLHAEVRMYWITSLLLRELLADRPTPNRKALLAYRIGDMRYRQEIVMPRATYERSAIIAELQEEAHLISTFTDHVGLRSRGLALWEMANDNAAKTA